MQINENELNYRLELFGLKNEFPFSSLSTYVIKKEKFKKILSESAITKLENFPITKKFSSLQNLDVDLPREEQNYNEYTEIYGGDEEFSNGDPNSPNFSRGAFENTYLETEHKPQETEQNEKSNETRQIFDDSILNRLKQLLAKITTNEDKVIIKAYRSKLKRKFKRIYEKNSANFNESTKYKIFHKCKFPGCERTFASCGWLKSHFDDHLSELQKCDVNQQFLKFQRKCK
jgi:hypothetical protein